MNFDEFVNFLSYELHVTVKQVKQSLRQASALRGVSLKDAMFIAEADNPNDFMDQCAGKCPCKLFQVVVTEGRNERELTIYSSKHKRHGYEQCSITTSPKKENVNPTWLHMYESNE